MADIQKIYDLIGEEKFKPQATIEERVTAIEEALQEQPMELIETISADEPITNLSRDTEPDGKKWRLSLMQRSETENCRQSVDTLVGQE